MVRVISEEVQEKKVIMDARTMGGEDMFISNAVRGASSSWVRQPDAD
jgi:hypothetical protein